MNEKKIKDELICKLKKNRIKLCAAESITGGRFIYEFIKKKGASNFIDFSIVCYSNNSKIKFLGLKKELEENHVISEIIAKKMAINITKHSKDQNVIGISCTGLASNHNNKNFLKVNVGTVFFAVYFKKKIKVKKKIFKGLRRNQVITKTVSEMIALCNSVI
tara:strand:+ start:678 stop:1163 length:486 start_codon:yes stop_codon:yes gene_type:complete